MNDEDSLGGCRGIVASLIFMFLLLLVLWVSGALNGVAQIVGVIS